MNFLRTAAAAAVLTPGLAFAAPVFDYFGSLSEATFGGTDIPNDEVSVAQQFSFLGDPGEITIALSATQRFFNPALTNDGLGTYFAGAGSNFGGPGSTSTTEGSLWNFNYFIRVESLTAATVKLSDYQIDLYYDFDPATNDLNDLTGMGKIDITAGLLGAASTSTLEEGSQNLLFGFLETGVPGLVTPPTSVTSFDPNALGEYTFAITVSKAGFPVESVAMDVQVVPVPAAAWLFGSALGLLAWVRRRSN